MADNIEITPGVGKTVAADDIGGVLFQRVKVTHGADGSATDVSSASNLPVADAAALAKLTDLYNAIVAGGATSANQATGNSSLASISSALPLIGFRRPVLATQTTSEIFNATESLTPKFAFANIGASATDSNVVTAVGSRKIRVLNVAIIAGGTATTVTFNSKGGGAGTAVSAVFANGANGGEVLGFSPFGWFETAVGEALTVTSGAGSTTGIQVTYIEV